MLSRRDLINGIWAAVPAAGTAHANRKAQPVLQYRWVYIASNLQAASEVERVLPLLHRAAACGYNGVALAEWKIMELPTATHQYLPNLKRVVDTAAKLGLSIVPMVCPMGASESILQRNPNLAEGVPCKRVALKVSGNIAKGADAGVQILRDGNLTKISGNRFTAWNYQDSPGEATFADGNATRADSPSLRIGIGAIGRLKGTNGRLYQNLNLQPYHQYRLTVWIKTEGFRALSNAGATVLDSTGKQLAFPQWSISGKQDWIQYQLVFNTLASSAATLILGVWGLDEGNIWFNSPFLEDAGMLNLLRRPGTPLHIELSGGQKLIEGKHYEQVHDARMGRVPYAGVYDISHDPPVITLKPGSAHLNGETLYASFWHAIPIYWGEVPACLADPEVFSIMAHQIDDVVAHMHPAGLFLSHDEIRVANWCNTCRAQHETPGDLLAHNVKQCQSLVKRAAPGAFQCIWSDMFDPYHNAHDDYYLVNGNLAGSWTGLNRSTLIANWNFERRRLSVPWFSMKGFEQILAGYYDGSADSIRVWLNEVAGISGVVGAMYTTWKNEYKDLEAFAHFAWPHLA